MWIFSGWLSVDPFRLFASEGIGAEAQRAYSGDTPLAFPAPAVLAASDLRPFQPDATRIERKATRLVAGAAILSIEALTQPDAYWYAVNVEVPLPVLRVKYCDAAGTWVHIDPATGELLGETDVRRRVYRWLFDLFHRWDLNLLLSTLPAHDLLIWQMSLAGLIGSVTAVYVGWIRLRRPHQSKTVTG